jgi:hypothetical protein
MNRTKIILICIFLLGFLIPEGKSADTIPSDTVVLPVDTSNIRIIKVSHDIYKNYRNKKAFIYERKPPVVNNFWSKILNKIGQFLNITFNSPVFSFLIYAVFFVIFVMLLILLIGGNFQTFFSKNKNVQGVVAPFIEEEIANTDFDLLISQELEKGNLNLAVRFLYLKLLQVLSQQHLINWQKDKTNREYIQELSNVDFSSDFKRVTNSYEYIWYGKFQISMDMFNDVRDHVNYLIRRIND